MFKGCFKGIYFCTGKKHGTQCKMKILSYIIIFFVTFVKKIDYTHFYYTCKSNENLRLTKEIVIKVFSKAKGDSRVTNMGAPFTIL